MTPMTPMTGPADLADPGFHQRADAPAVWRRLRAEDPVHWNPPGEWPGFWAVTRHADAVRVLRDPATFASRHGIMLDRDPPATDPAADRMVVASDPPVHAALRAALTAAMTASRIARVMDRIDRTATRLVRDLLAAERGDVVAAVAAPLPLSVICELMAIPEADQPTIFRLTSTASGADDPDFQTAATTRTRALAHAELLAYVAVLLDRRRRDPGDDVLSGLAHAEVAGRPMTHEEALLNCDNLLIGGNEPARQALAGTVLALIDHPAQWDRLAAGQVPSEPAVEEALRYTTPVRHLLRTARVDVELHGRRIAAGDRVAVWLTSANRDERRFDQPDRLDLARSPNQHLTFTVGPHYCFGTAVARRQVGALLGALARQVGGLSPAGPVRRLRSNFLDGIKSMEVAVRPRSRTGQVPG